MTRRLLQKSLIIGCCLFMLSAGAFAASDLTISDKLLQAFHKTFPDAQEVKWAETEDRFLVNFKQGDILAKVEYDKEGNFISSLRYYSEKNLPVNILCRLQKKYADKKVFGVTELTSEASVEYYIKLEDAQSWITVKSNVDGAMQVVERYKKAS